MLICKWCREPATWSRLFDTYWCADCRVDDVIDIDQGQEQEANLNA